MNVKDIRNQISQKYFAKDFTKDRSGCDMIEILGASFIADEPVIFGTVNQEYVDAEIKWYNSESLNINDIYSDKEPPRAWVGSADKHGNINSNYGNLIFSEKYYKQYFNVAYELMNNPDTRRATMIYNRPSIWTEYDENGKSDFICTNAVSYYIRNNKLHAVVQMRSCDLVFGFKNDYAWQKYVQTILLNDIQAFPDIIELGDIIWQVQNAHVYSRHFHLIEKYVLGE